MFVSSSVGSSHSPVSTRWCDTTTTFHRHTLAASTRSVNATVLQGVRWSAVADTTRRCADGQSENVTTTPRSAYGWFLRLTNPPTFARKRVTLVMKPYLATTLS